MDHAKALADALRPIAALADGYEDSLTGDFIVGVALARLRDAQMALDAHPAEAATRENGKEISPYNIPMDRISKAARGMFIDNQKNPPATNDMFEYSDFVAPAAWNEARLSTHQQQGDVKLIGRLRDIADALASECHPRSTVEAITEAADALSRAPQPDTVTEEMVDAALKAYGNGWVSAADHRQHTFEPMKAAITAALNAKGK